MSLHDFMKARMLQTLATLPKPPRTGKLTILVEVSFAEGGVSGLDVHANVKEHFAGKDVTAV